MSSAARDCITLFGSISDDGDDNEIVVRMVESRVIMIVKVKIKRTRALTWQDGAIALTTSMN